MKTRCISWLGGVALFSATLGVGAYADDSSWINEQLAEFAKNPQAFAVSQERQTKYSPKTSTPIQVTKRFTDGQIKDRSYIETKDKIRMTIMNGDDREGRAPILSNDNPYKLVDELRYNRLEEMERYRSSYLANPPWSDDYWPIYSGVIAKRYADANYPDDTNWRTNASYISRFLSPYACTPNVRSPAEKYDLLVGDSNFTLTRKMLAEGKGYYDTYGKVETWMGICHGWAPASFMIARPTQYVDVMAADGRTPIRFYPADIRALSSLLWAKASPPSRFVGGRCNDKSPAEDQYGRIQSQDCFDNNPATWHLSLVNQVGVSQRSLVYDKTYDYEVWNQPVYSYEYTYFNPATRRAVATLEEARVDRRYFRNDVFSRYRSQNAAYVVGIAMKVVYVSETAPDASATNSPSEDQRVLEKYFYDLELDRNGKIIGGEWYQRNHPDFMYTYGPTARANSVGDEYIRRSSEWNGYQPMPSIWKRAAKEASEQGQPLSKIVDVLVKLSNTSR